MILITPLINNYDIELYQTNPAKEFLRYIDNYCEKCQPMLIKRNGKIVPMKRRKFNEYRQILLKRSGKE